ncbi:creatininase family protein [Nocardia sp. BMG51109]|uniref:creatininase family protein n=1 Tax=Nocardia sp. BMG51109 TaxID=1056816 RepID=UPI0004665276|nr:creatininase family protein [Nocardia sp. BMG51109]
MFSLLTTATSADAAAGRARAAVLPIGSFEQHGSHLPLVTDTAIACLIAERIASLYDLFLLPPITVSCSHEHAGFPGTVSIRATTLVAVVDDIVESLARSGISTIVIVNGHGGNYVLSNVVCQYNEEGRHAVLFPGKEDWSAARSCAGMLTSLHDDMHGGEFETSILMYAFPELVGETYACADHDVVDRPHFLITGMAGYAPGGIIGRPSLASAEKGRAALDSLTKTFGGHLEALTM